MMDPQNLEELENTVQSMQWDTVALEPSAEEVQALDQQLPDSWLVELEQEQAFDREVLEPLTTMSDQELNTMLDIPEGDINLNAEQAVQEIGLDVDALIRDIEGQEIPMD